VERLRYLSHENSADDEGYVKFLLRPFHWAQNFIEIKGDILDYGCGYAPVFAEQMRQRGYSCDGYDPLFFPEGAHKDQYPEIFCMETVEHFHDTYAEWGKLMNFMSPGGYLIVMTDYWLDLAAFPNWYYQNDLTHTSFYHPSTMEYIAKAFDRELLQTDGKRLALFHYP